MKNCIVCLFSIFVIGATEDKHLLETRYIDVPLDHFSYTTNQTFKLKYLINDTYHAQGGPIFFYTGNEGNIDNFARNTGFIYEIAPSFEAVIVFAEHRYYGNSLPFGNQSYISPTNLGYLSSQQALADFVFLISHLQDIYTSTKKFDKDLPVISFGGSYGGMLAAWIRMKYPASVLGAIASSAPIWQFKGLTPCENFNRITTSVYGSFGSKSCTDTIQKSWKIIRSFTQTTPGKQNLSALWNLCTALSTDDDIKTLIDWVAEILVNMAMVNYPYPTSFLVNLPAYPVLEFCSKLDSLSWNDDYGHLQALGEALQIYTNYTHTSKCNDIKETSAELGENGWNFQSCTEMIMPMCSTDTDMFENENWDFEKYSDLCFKMFKLRPRSENVPIIEYGGKDIESASNIVFSNGLLDPWSSGGVLRNINDNVKAIVIPDGAHHYDLRGSNEKDTGAVKYVRSYHEKEIKKWIKKYYADRPNITLV